MSKSQPEITIRRLAVFGGYRDLEAGTAWHRADTHEPTSAEPAQIPVIRLDCLPHSAAGLPVAA